MSFKDFKKYCDIIHGNDPIYFAAYSGGPSIQMFGVSPTLEVYEDLEKHNNAGYDIYNIVQPTQGFTDNDTKGCKFLFADWDTGRTPEGPYKDIIEVCQIKIEKIREWDNDISNGILPEPTMIVETRNGLQVFWKLKNTDNCSIDSHEAYTDMQKRIVARMESDGSVCNPARVMRVSGFMWKKISQGLDPYPTTILRHNSDNSYTSDEMEQYFPETEETIEYKELGHSRRSYSSGGRAIEGTHWVCFSGKEPFEVAFFYENDQLHGGCIYCDDPHGHDLVMRSEGMGYCNRCHKGFYATDEKKDLFRHKKDASWVKIKEARKYRDVSMLDDKDKEVLRDYITYKNIDRTVQEFIVGFKGAIK
jgi:hypothetical protein